MKTTSRRITITDLSEIALAIQSGANALVRQCEEEDFNISSHSGRLRSFEAMTKALQEFQASFDIWNKLFNDHK